METNEADSVMAVLTDLDKLCPKQPSREKQRVLSDAYIFKTMSIGRRRESLLASRGNSGTNKMKIGARSSTHMNNPFFESLSGRSPEDRKVLGKKDEHSMKRKVLRCREKAEHDLPCIDYMSVSLKSQLEMIDKCCHFPNTVSSFGSNPRKKVRDVLQDLKWDYRRYREQIEHLRPKNEEHRDTSAKHSCVSCSRTMSRSWKQEECFTKFKDVWIPGKVGNNFQEIKENGNNPGAKIQRYGEADDGRMDDQCMKIDPSQRVSDSATSNLPSHCESGDSFAGLEASKADLYINYGSSCSKSDITISSKESEQSWEVGSEEESMNVSFEGESAPTRSSKSATPKFLDELNGRYQLSPDSVLEQSGVQILARFKHFDDADLWKQLQSLNIELEGTYSEESAIFVSDEEDADHTSVSLCEDDIKIKQWFGDHESKNYSYMVDVLDESRIFSTEPYMDFNTWHSLECPISPSLFEALEIKYGKQISFDKNHRHLLFDRINSGLVSIFNPDTNFHVCATSMKRKFFSCLRRDEVEDELWRILTCQEKAKTKDLSEKAVDKWFGFEEGICIVCSELESFLFDELVMEFLSM